MCIDYKKFIQANTNDHFPLSFMDNIFERLVDQAFYYFLDGPSKYRRSFDDLLHMSYCNFCLTGECLLGCVMFLQLSNGACKPFSDMIEKCIKAFMDDFSVFGSPFTNCLQNLDNVLKICVEINLIINWEKHHFMVKEGIMLRHKISAR